MIKRGRLGAAFVCGILAVGAGLLGFWPVAALLGLSGLVLAATSFGGRGQSSDRAEGLGDEARWLLRPLYQQRDSFRALAKQSSDPAVSVVAMEAVSEADSICERAERLAAIRQELKRGLKGRGEAQTNLVRLQSQYAHSESDSERSTIESAITARQTELASYDQAEAKVKEIESKVKMAEATLAELKARLATGAASASGHSEINSEMDDVMNRLKTLGSSFEEAQQALEVGQQ